MLCVYVGEDATFHLQIIVACLGNSCMLWLDYLHVLIALRLLGVIIEHGRVNNCRLFYFLYYNNRFFDRRRR